MIISASLSCLCANFFFLLQLTFDNLENHELCSDEVCSKSHTLKLYISSLCSFFCRLSLVACKPTNTILEHNGYFLVKEADQAMCHGHRVAATIGDFEHTPVQFSICERLSAIAIEVTRQF